LTCICEQEVRTICESFADARGLPNYPHGVIFTFWEQYVRLRFYLAMAAVAALAAVFITLAIILFNIVAALLVVLSFVCRFLYHILYCDTGYAVTSGAQFTKYLTIYHMPSVL